MDNTDESFAMQQHQHSMALSEWDRLLRPSFQSLTTSRSCTEDNVDECLVHLNKVFRNMCLSSWIEEEQNPMVSLVNACSEVIDRYQQDSRIREDLEERTRRTMSNYDQLYTAQLRLKDDIERLEREIALKQEKEKDFANKNKNLCSAIKSEKDEVKRLTSVLHHRESQYKHESKKKERETNRLKEKLNQVLMDRSQKIIGNDVINILPKTDSKRGTWKTTSKPEELYKLMLQGHEEKQKQIMQENLDLRNCLATIQQRLHSLVECYKAQLKTSGSADSSFDEENFEDNLEKEEFNDKFQLAVCNGDVSGTDYLPFWMDKEDIMKNFNKACHLLVQLLKRKLKESEVTLPVPSPPAVMAGNSQAEHELQLLDLRKEVEEYQNIIEVQDQALRKRSFNDEKFQQLKQNLLQLNPGGRNKTNRLSCGNRLLPMTPSSRHSANQKPNKSEIYKTLDLCQNHFQNGSRCSLDGFNVPDPPQSSSPYSSPRQYARSQSLHESFFQPQHSLPTEDHPQNNMVSLRISSSNTPPSCRRQSAPIKSSVSNSMVISNDPGLRRNMKFTSLTSLNDQILLSPDCLSRGRSHSVDDQRSSQTDP